MIRLAFELDSTAKCRVLFLGAHCDDIEIGCGGTILKLINSHKNIEVNWVVFSSNQQRFKEATRSANSFLENVKEKKITIESFKDGFFPYIGGQIKELVEEIKREISPDIIFTHHRDDLHQDHRLISELTWNTFRDHLILEYEILKYDGDLGCPNVFVHLDEPTCNRKIKLILENFRSQNHNHWFSKETFLSIMRIRGIESNSSSKYAEGFYCRKLVL